VNILTQPRSDTSTTDTTTGDRRGPGRRPRPVLRLLALLAALAIACSGGVVVAQYLTRPATVAPAVVYEEPNANTREDRVPRPVPQEPNANNREDRVPRPVPQEPNANNRESRVTPR
jgi:hypothetical protein